VSTAAIPVHVALVDTTGAISTAELARVAGALNEQVQADFAPAWKVAATVGAYPEAPPYTWAVRVQRGLDVDAAGYHWAEGRQPYALVDYDRGGWTVTASHELLEMLADPWGNRLHEARALSGWAGGSARVRYLIEVGDPCEAITYRVGGVEVSDFVLPDFYRSSGQGPSARYSYTGSVPVPLDVLDHGYISFVDPADDHLWQRFVDGQVSDVDRGPAPPGLSLREFADEGARAQRGHPGPGGGYRSSDEAP
jgi:hypothetical protein